MNTVNQMMHTHPKPYAVKMERLTAAIFATGECAQTCTVCADACLSEDMIAELRRCVRLNLDCADVCTATARLLSRQTEPDVSLLRCQLESCIKACMVCSNECAQHAKMHEHCKVCSEVCQRCEEACKGLLEVLTA